MNNYIKQLESESIYIIREAVRESNNPVMLYSIGKDSGVMLEIARKAYFPSKIPFPLLHVDTGYKFPEMYDMRDKVANMYGVKLIVYSDNLDNSINPTSYGKDNCCRLLKTNALNNALKKYNFDVSFGGARREEEKSRSKERIFSLRNKFNKWDTKNQRPELWNIFNTLKKENENIRVFPLSNWTEKDIWRYIKYNNLPVVPLYFSKNNKRYRSLGCHFCTDCVESSAQNVDEIIKDLEESQFSERSGRAIDKTSSSAMEQKKKEGYF